MHRENRRFILSTMIRRYHGTLLGLACGDALGTTLEFKAPGSFQPIDDMCGGGPFRLKPGEWTDDTSMALCLAESLIECRGFDAMDQLDRYVRWYQEGHLSSTGVCFDIGNTVRSALDEYIDCGIPFSASKAEHTQGNGSLMRLAAVPMYFASDPQKAIHNAALSSRTTHPTEACQDACRYFCGLIVGALNGATKDELLSKRYCPIDGYWQHNPLCSKIDEIAEGSFKAKEPPAIQGSGYVVKSLEAALWAFHKSTSFRDGCLLAVNLGDDADTTGAIYGQIAGAYYGDAEIPHEWRNCLAMGSTIIQFATQLYGCADAQRLVVRDEDG